MLKYKWVDYENNVFHVADHLENRLVNQRANQRGSRRRLDEAKCDARFLEKHVVIEESNGEW